MIENFKIDKSDWKPVKFGDVVKEPKTSVRDAVAEGIERVVGLEHIDPESIHLKRFAGIDESTTFSKKFSPGDVLFGRRRAYLKKAAQATFEGICSGDITVMRVKNDRLLPELLPFIVQNEKFFDYAIEHSAGGLSPRVKFQDLANYEFLLPPKEQQAELAELLWSMDEIIEKELRAINTLDIALSREIEDKLHGVELDGKTIREVIDELSEKQKVKSLDELGRIYKGKGIPKSDVTEIGVPCIRYGELYTNHHRIIRRFHSYISIETCSSAFQIEKNDILFAGSGETITEIGKSAAYISDEIAYAGSDMLVFRPNDMDGTYLGYLMNSQLVRQQLNKYGTGATVIHIYQDDLKKIKVPDMPRVEQIKIGKYFEVFAQNIKNAESKVSLSKSLQKSLINQVF
jgi:type I restriction enzyme S subunit